MELYSQPIKKDKDILAARDRARVICEELGFGVTQQLQVTTAVFELGKNILEHGEGGSLSFSLQSEGDELTLEVVGRDQGPGMTEPEVDELLKSGTTKSTANRGIPAMKRLMDSIDIETEPGSGTTIRLIKKKTKPTKSLAENVVGFIQGKFSSRKNLTLSEELRKQNINLVQTLSLYEEKNEELKKKNKELLDLKQQLEQSNAELHDRTAELQDALLSLGDRTSELESQNRRFTAVLEHIPDGVVITDRSGVVSKANQRFYHLFGLQSETVEELRKMDWYSFLGRFRVVMEEDWTKQTNEWDRNPIEIHAFPLQSKNNGSQMIHCRTAPIQDGDGKFLGRVWIFEPHGCEEKERM